MTSPSDAIRNKYALTGWIYDILNYPWERQYTKWRPTILADVHGDVLEVGSGTGRNFPFYHEDVRLTAVELSPVMRMNSKKRADTAKCEIQLLQGDASQLSSQQDNTYDWVIGTFICCVMPDALQPAALRQFHRVLKPGGRFKLLEIIYSQDRVIRKRQERFAPLIEKIYGARFDRNTLGHLQAQNGLLVTHTQFLKDDTYLLIEGCKQ